jgi:hypothetical protein
MPSILLRETRRGLLTIRLPSSINKVLLLQRSRGDLGQLAPRKKLLKGCRVSQREFSEIPSEHFGTEGFFYFLPSFRPKATSFCD